MEQFTVGDVRLPCLDITSRATAKREKRYWALQYELLDKGCLARTSKRVSLAKHAILVSNSMPIVVLVL